MFVVTLLPSRGNPNAPEFPFDGLFGLTDVSIRGKLSVKFDQRHPNPKPIDAVHAVVRLVRIDTLNRSSVRDVVCQETVWSAAGGAAVAKMSEFEADFALVVPSSTPGLSRMGMMLGKMPGYSASTAWKLEAVVTFPRERPVLATPRDVSLLRHCSPALSLPSIPSLVWASSVSPFSPHPISLDYDVRMPSRPLGWNDSSELSFHFRAPQNVSFHLKSFELILCREVTVLQGSTTATTVVDDVPLELYRAEDSSNNGTSTFASPACTPTEECERLVWRSPSPPEKPTTLSTRSSWPISLVQGEAGYIEARGMLRFRPRPASNHRWSLGETGENKFIRIAYSIRPRIIYKRSHGSFASERHFDLDRLPIQIAAVNFVDRAKTLRTPRLATPTRASSSDRRMGERRNSAFDLKLNLSPTSLAGPAPLSMAPSAQEERRHVEGVRPLSSRRRSEQSEVFGQPARTRPRTEEPKPKRRPVTATGIVPTPAVPDIATMPRGLSTSSTYDSLGPDTPNTLEFLLTPAPTVKGDDPASPSRTGTFPLATPVHRLHTSSSPRPPSSRSNRSARHAYRPRSAGTLSIASTTSTTSSVAESSSRFTREMSAPPGGASSSTILESSHELLGLSLSDSYSRHNPHSPLANGIAVPTPTSRSPSPSPSSSPELSFTAGLGPRHTFDSYTISSTKSSIASTPHLPLERIEVAPWEGVEPPELELVDGSRETSPSTAPDFLPPRPAFHVQSPPRILRQSSASSGSSSNARNPSPPSPPRSLKSSALRNSTALYTSGVVANSSRTSLSPESASTAQQKRKGSVGGLLSLITRRGSKA
ncbi:hypothetical protein JCM10212_002844 [Sporobolomyces blumeae]